MAGGIALIAGAVLVVVPVRYGCEPGSGGIGAKYDLSALLLNSVDF